MTYKQTLDFLFSQLPAYHRIGKAAYKNNLDNIIKLDNYLGNPHLNYKTIHVAGTNGKGSVAHMIASVLQEAGYRTGLYTSPHLKDFRERIRVNGKPIPQREVTQFVKRHSGMTRTLQPSFFEITVAMAFDYFARAEVDVAVIEVGLGGRLDSTNIITPVISIITNIGHDHMDILGDTPEKIATEKAGIIKKEIPVVIGEIQDGTKYVFEMKAAESGSAIYFAEDYFSCRLEKPSNINGERKYFMTDLKTGKETSGFVPLGGDYQEKNLRTVFQALSILSRSFGLSDKIIIDGIHKVIINTGLMGRWQILGTEPLIVCDTGHNKEGLQYIMHQIDNIRPEKLHMVIGFVADKDLSLILPLLPRDAEYYFTKAAIPRALDEKLLQSQAHESGLSGKSYPSVREALKAAKSNASGTDMIFIGGSTFIVAEVI